MQSEVVMKTIKRLLEKFFSSPNNLTLFRVASIPVLILLLLFSLSFLPHP